MNIKNSLALFFTCLFATFSALAENYKIDDHTNGAHAFIQFKAAHLGYSYIVGRFNKFEGVFNYDEKNPSTASVNVKIQTSSVDSNHAERDKHLRSKDFFNAKAFPDITFNSTSFSENSDGNISVTGELSLHGTTKTVTITGRHIGQGKDPWGGYRNGFEGTVILDSSEYGFPGWVGKVEVYLVIEGIRI